MKARRFWWIAAALAALFIFGNIMVSLTISRYQAAKTAILKARGEVAP